VKKQSKQILRNVLEIMSTLPLQLSFAVKKGRARRKHKRKRNDFNFVEISCQTLTIISSANGNFI